MLAEQANKRLHYANNRFILDSTTTLPAGSSRMLITVWRVEDEYVFASFEEQKKKGRHDVTVIPMPGGRQLRLPDGLSHDLTTLGLAMEFSHYADWREQWSLPASR